MSARAYTSFREELMKLSASSERLTLSKSRSGRRPMSVTTLLAKDRAGTLHKKDDGLSKKAFKLQGHLKFQGIPIAIENRKGSTREGVDPDGKPWKTTFALPYGYIKKTEGKDGEEIDAYIGPKDDATHAFVVHQRKIDGTGHDEDKVFLGMPSVEAVRKAYLKHYNKVGPKLLGEISTISMDMLKAKLEESRKHTKLAVALDNPNSVSGSRKGDVPSRDGNATSAGKIEEQSVNLPLDITTTVTR
jgi:inorganic pyrophosphatase